MSDVFRPRVDISLTTIPTRLDRIVQESLLDLLQQDYPVTTIYLTVPKTNMRGQPVKNVMPEWLSQEPLASKVTVLRPDHDYGPIMKWVGAAAAITDPNGWVFVCDDDVRYDHHYISTCVEEAAKVPSNERSKCLFNTNLFDNVTENVQIFNIDLLWGVHGVFVPQLFIEYIHNNFDTSLPNCCLRIDDDVVSVMARDGGYKKVSIPHGLNVGHALITLQPDALSTSYNKISDRHKCHSRINPDYGDNLLVVVIVLACLLFVMLIISLILGFFIFRQSRRITPRSKSG
jgi:hypothetical protein